MDIVLKSGGFPEMPAEGRPLLSISIYDEVAFPSYPYALSHPERLATIAQLSGINPATVDRCRVLELGCGAGGNLLPMAERMPGSEFVGIDLSRQQIAIARAYATKMGLKNLHLEARDILALSDSLGQFDFVIVHGVFSWTTDAVREKLLAICREILAPQGIAYINFNTYPGWCIQGMLRDLLRFHSWEFPNPPEQVHEARRMIRFLQEALSETNTVVGSLVRAELAAIQNNSDPFLYHAFLNVINQPFYLHELQERSAQHGLRYFGDADPDLSWPENSSPIIARKVKELTPDESRWPQLFDFVRFTTSRRSLFCRQEVPAQKEPPFVNLEGLHVSSALRPVVEFSQTGTSTFVSPSGKRVSTRDPVLRATLELLCNTWPESIPFSQLLDLCRKHCTANETKMIQATERWSHDVWQCFCQSVVELSVLPSGCSRKFGDRPIASRLARIQASQLEFVTNLRHQAIHLNEFDRRVLAVLDGTLAIADIAKQLGADPTTESLARLANNSLLLTPHLRNE